MLCEPNNIFYYCPRCHKPLRNSDVDGYAFVCYECDENFYRYEADVIAELNERTVGYLQAQGILMALCGGTYYGDSSDMIERAKQYVYGFDKKPDDYRIGFASGIYSMHVCG